MLNLLANPLTGRILRAHAEKPLRLAEVHEETGWPPQTTLRAAIGRLRSLGFLNRRELGGMPYGVANELSPAGEEVLFVASVLERWLRQAPLGPIEIDSEAGKAAIKALAGGWSSTMVWALASEPASLTELDRRIPDISYPSLERRLSRMRATRQVEPTPGGGRGRPFAVTEWLRQSVAPLCAAGRCERLYLREESAPITAVEIEAAFLLCAPLSLLPESSEGTCVLTVTTEGLNGGSGDPKVAGVTIEVAEGRIVRCVAEVQEDVPTWALGTPMTWLNAVIEGKLEGLRFGGASPQLAADMAQGIHLGLFGD